MLAIALFAAAVTMAAPCDVISTAEVERALGGAVVDVPAAEIGEETAPMCLWATAKRKAEIKLSLWSVDELPVLGLSDASAYFVKLQAEAEAFGGAIAVTGLGERAFEAGFSPSRISRAAGQIVFLKAGRLAVVEFSNVRPGDARAIARAAAEQL